MHCSTFSFLLRAACTPVVARARTFALLLIVSGAASAEAQFLGLGGMAASNGIASGAIDISADGSVIVGHVGTEAFLWPVPTSGFGLGRLEGSCCSSSARATSQQGTVVVGNSNSIAAGGNGREAFRWTQDTGMIGLGFLSKESRFSSFAHGVSDDGAVVVGHSEDNARTQPFVWREATGMQPLELIAEDSINWVKNAAWNVSPDGNIVVGGMNNGPGWEAFRWTEGEGTVGLGAIDGGIGSVAFAASYDGEVIVGESTSNEGTQAFRWTAQTGMAGLGDLPGGDLTAAALDVTHDGSIVVGRGITEMGSTAFIWDGTRGMRSLRDALIDDYGFDLTAWHLTSAHGISGDGLTIVGTGVNPQGTSEAWVVIIPEPNSFYLYALGGACIFTCGLLCRARAE